jgi:hypothetical protein
MPVRDSDLPRVLLSDNVARLARLLSTFAAFHHKSIKLEELAHYCLSLQATMSASMFPAQF